MPLSWKHFVYGMAHLNRREARDRLKMANAVRAGMAPESPQRDAWHRVQSKIAGLPEI
jgi:hypothetical protein